MEVKILFYTLIITILISGTIIPTIFKIDRFLNVKQKPESAITMGLSIIIILIISSFSIFFINKYLLIFINDKYLTSIAFFLLIIFFAQLFKIIIKKYNSKLSITLSNLITGNNLPLHLMINSTILGAFVSILNIKYGFIAGNFGFLKTILHSVVTGVSFTVILLLFAGIYERLEFAEIPAKLKRFVIALATGGLLAIAFYGFSGITI